MDRFCDVKARLGQKELQKIMALSQYKPEPEKTAALAKRLMGDKSVRAYGWEREGRVVGLVVIRLQEDDRAEITALAVSEDCQGQKVGRELLNGLEALYPWTELFAETDKEAVGFYRRCGFAVQELGEKHPGICRYACVKAATEAGTGV